MKLFKRNKKEAKGFNESPKFEESVTIPHYAPNQGLQPRAYLLSVDLEKFEASFEKYCKNFLMKSNPDSFNGPYMDALIQKYVAEALSFLSIQRSDHIFLITNVLSRLHDGDKIKCQAKLNSALLEQAELQNELIKLRKIYRAKTSLYDEAYVSKMEVPND